MTYLKLCQILCQSDTEIFYQENADKQVLVEKIIAFPCEFICEIIEWPSEQDFINRVNPVSFKEEKVTLENYGSDIRMHVYFKLNELYPTLQM